MGKFLMKSTDILKNERQIDLYQQAQKYIDSECIRRMDPYTKRKSGALIKSATALTKIGSGFIKQWTPYARVQYYNYEAVQNDTGLRGRYWFERMKADNLTDLKRGIAELTGGQIKL